MNSFMTASLYSIILIIFLSCQQVQTLLALKAEYKKVSGNDWTVNSKPSGGAVAPAAAPAVTPAPASGSNAADSILLKIAAQGEKIRQLKGEKADKKTIEPEVTTNFN